MEIQPVLEERFGLVEFRPGQREAITALLDTGRAIAVFPTGSGKSLVFQLPALLLDGLTLVVSPLLSLMKDQIDALRARGIAADRLDSTLGREETLAVGDRVRRGETRILYVAPERFNNERFLAQMAETTISLLAVDEAHCISQWGHNFRPDYLRLARTAREIGVERVVCLTATATPPVIEDIREAFDVPETSVVVTGFHRPNLNLLVTPVPRSDRATAVAQRLLKRPLGPTIVYVTLQKDAVEMAAALREAGLETEHYHAGMTSEDREAVQDRWKASERGIVVATIAFGMGIDKADVRHVIHASLPKSLENYMQEIGRAGRDGRASTVEVLASREDVPILEEFTLGDAPPAEGIAGLVAEVLATEGEYVSEPYALAKRYGLRPLVLKTALTYLELEGAVRKGTPFYATYKYRPLGGDIQELTPLLSVARRGPTWTTLDPAQAAERLGMDRRDVTRLLERHSETGRIELVPSDLRDRYRVLVGPQGAGRLAEILTTRFREGEARELGRLQVVLDFADSAECRWRVLCRYFGEELGGPCGHCDVCRGRSPGPLP